MFRPENRLPNYRNLGLVLEKKCPERPTLFEFFLNPRLDQKLAGYAVKQDDPEIVKTKFVIDVFNGAGYDYANITGSEFGYPRKEHEKQDSISINEGLISSRDDFDKLEWPDARKCNYAVLRDIQGELPKGMKLNIYGRDGIFENVTRLLGYENMCVLTYEDEQLVSDVFEKVGSAYLDYYKMSLEYDTVGAVICNDDWGFKTSTLITPEQLRKYVFPWYKEIVKVAHEKGKYAILHSCGYFMDIIDDVIDDMKFDGRHSYEDAIMPIEEAYDFYQGRIAAMGGLDMDFVARKPAEEVAARARKMLDKTKEKGGYALGTGNSVPSYIPDENYFAMIGEAFRE